MPHAGYEILKRWSASLPSFVFTSNVDGHFFKARMWARQPTSVCLVNARPTCPFAGQLRPATRRGDSRKYPLSAALRHVCQLANLRRRRVFNGFCGQSRHFFVRNFAPAAVQTFDSVADAYPARSLSRRLESQLPTVPRGEAKGQLARPNILMFDDDGWLSDRTDKQCDRHEEVRKSSDVPPSPLFVC